jgi:hypothetical protein
MLQVCCGAGYPTVTAYPWEGGRKRRPLTASFLHPVQGVSPAALNALAAAPGRQVYIGALITPSTEPAGIMFVDDGEIGGSTTEDSAIGTEGSSSSVPTSSSSSECLDVIDPRILADSERSVIEGETWS